MKKTKTKNELPEVVRGNKELKHQIFILENQIEQLEREFAKIESKIKALS